MRFNPLHIGAVFQTVLGGNDGEMATIAFQSPPHRGSVSDKSKRDITSHIAKSFQSPPHRGSVSDPCLNWAFRIKALYPHFSTCLKKCGSGRMQNILLVSKTHPNY